MVHVEQKPKAKPVKTTAWKEAYAKCVSIIEKLKKHPGSDIFMKPPQPTHANYAELMTDYTDLTIIQRNLLDGLYYGTFGFI